MNDLNNIDLKEYVVHLSVPKSTLKEMIPEVQSFDDIMKEMISRAEQQLITSMKEVEPNFPDEIFIAFVHQFMDLKFSVEENIKLLSYEVICIPEWKDVNLIDYNSEEQKLLNSYFDKVKKE